MNMLHPTSPEEFDRTIAAHPRLLVAFSKDDCPGCRMLELALCQFAASTDPTGIALAQVKLEDLGEDYFRGLGLRQTPTLALYRDGVEQARLPGFQTPAQIGQAVSVHFTGAPA